MGGAKLSSLRGSPAAGDARTFPHLPPRIADRMAACARRVGPLLSLYALVPVPLLTDWIENGALPGSPRGWTTEIFGGLVILALVERVRRDHRALERLARCDGLTGLLNRRSFDASLELELARARRLGVPLSVVSLDLDQFKDVNDRLGHAAGDQVLRQLGAAITATIRAGTDTAYRIGGDEFAVLLPASREADARRVVARIRDVCAVHDPRWAVGALAFSAGVVELAPDETAPALLSRSDAAMYASKRAAP